MVGLLVGALPGRVSDFLAVILVLTTQMGFVNSTVALPASAPAIIDSIVVSFELLPALMAARSNPARVHSYPSYSKSMESVDSISGGGTIIVDEVGDTDPK